MAQFHWFEMKEYYWFVDFSMANHRLPRGMARGHHVVARGPPKFMARSKKYWVGLDCDLTGDNQMTSPIDYTMFLIILQFPQVLL